MSFGLYLSFNLNAIVDIILPFIILWIFNFQKKYYYWCIHKASLIIAFICLFSIISFFTGIYNVKPNGPWSSTFGEAAFGGYSTGYSNSLFLFVPFLVFWHRKYNKKLFSRETIAIITIIVAQYIAGGRAGLIASLLVFFSRL
jgi:magnesium-transporting ATPase (P-type)